MSVKVMAKVLAHVQRLAAEEDILSGVLARFLEPSRSATEAFFHIVLKASSVKPRDYNTSFPEAFQLATAEKISKKRYAWIEDKRIAFAPDIWIYDAAGDEWDEVKPKPQPSFHFLIECKESARVTKGQMRGYPFFEDDLFGRTQPRAFTLLIHGETDPEEAKIFSHQMNWVQTAAVMEQALAAEADAELRAELSLLLDLYRYSLVFDKEAYAAARDDEAAHGLLVWIRSRLRCEGTIEPRGRPLVKPLGKWLCLSSDQKLQLWLRAERKEGVYQVQIETWLDQAMTAKPIKIGFPETNAAEDSNAWLSRIAREQQIFAEGQAT